MPDIDSLEAENERKSLELSIAQKQALIAEAKRRYGKDWKRFIPFSGGGSSGMDWSSLKFTL